jgi:hypothetical protein
LFTLDTEWTKENVIPMLSSKEKEFVRFAWAGFLCNPRFSPSLATEVSPYFVSAVDLLRDYGTVRPNLGAFPIALHFFFRDQFTVEWLRDTLRAMDGQVLAEAIRGIVRFLPDKSEIQSAWTNWVHGVLKDGLPAKNECYSSDTSLAMVELIISLDSLSEEAFTILRPHLIVTEQFGYAIHRMNEGDPSFLDQHTELALRMVCTLVKITAGWEGYEVDKFLSLLREKSPVLTADPDYLRLKDILDSSG